jgi:omega-6 fatty acid desaturase (delta-12 desaturase)
VSEPAQTQATAPASPAEVAHLRPSDAAGALITAWVVLVTAAGVTLSRAPELPVWLAGQAVLAVGLVQWFVLLHECGHRTLFASRRANDAVGAIAGLLAQLPLVSWRLVHARHHLWTGWQDLDPTTQALVPRPLSRLEAAVVDVAWATGAPFVALTYRTGTFWRPGRLARMFPRARRRVVLGVGLHALATASLAAGLVVTCGPTGALRLVGLALLLAYAVQDPLLLSQHTHIPQRLARGAQVRPIPAREQAEHTRSLLVPGWVSRLVLFGFDAHELHHVHPGVPGWRLASIAWRPPNALAWWRWLLHAKRLRGSVLLFQNRAATGAPL